MKPRIVGVCSLTLVAGLSIIATRGSDVARAQSGRATAPPPPSQRTTDAGALRCPVTWTAESLRAYNATAPERAAAARVAADEARLDASGGYLRTEFKRITDDAVAWHSAHPNLPDATAPTEDPSVLHPICEHAVCGTSDRCTSQSMAARATYAGRERIEAPEMAGMRACTMAWLQFRLDDAIDRYGCGDHWTPHGPRTPSGVMQAPACPKPLTGLAACPPPPPQPAPSAFHCPKPVVKRTASGQTSTVMPDPSLNEGCIP